MTTCELCGKPRPADDDPLCDACINAQLTADGWATLADTTLAAIDAILGA